MDKVIKSESQLVAFMRNRKFPGPCAKVWKDTWKSGMFEITLTNKEGEECKALLSEGDAKNMGLDMRFYLLDADGKIRRESRLTVAEAAWMATGHFPTTIKL